MRKKLPYKDYRTVKYPDIIWIPSTTYTFLPLQLGIIKCTEIRYLILESKLFWWKLGNNLLLMDDNAHSNCAALVTDDLEGKIIKQMVSPAYSNIYAQ